MTIKAIIFDLDGTLVHTVSEYRYAVVKKTLKELGVSSFSKKNTDKFWFGGNRNKTIREIFKVEPEVFWKVFHKHDTIEEREKHTKAYEDVDFIKELKKEGYKTGIVTGSIESIALMEIKMVGKESFDAIIITQISNGVEPKPHPSGLERCINMLGVKKDEVIYVGNSDEDIIAAKNAGVLDVLIDRNEYEIDEKIKPTYKIKTLYELKDILLRINLSEDN